MLHMKLMLKNLTFILVNESYGAHAEYIRDGLNYELWRKNLVQVIEKRKC
jgi:hypothetical protein